MLLRKRRLPVRAGCAGVLPAPGAAAAAITAAAASAAASASTAVAARAARFLHGQVPSVELRTVQSAHCGGGFLVGAHFHESETAGAAGIPISHHLGGFDLAMLCKQLE